MLGKRFRLAAKDRRGKEIAFYVSLIDKRTMNITVGQGSDQIDIYVSAPDFLGALYELKNGKPFTGKHAAKETDNG